MSLESRTNEERADSSAVAVVDPRAPRFGQAITASLLVLAVAFQQQLLVFAVAAILGTAALTGWRVDPYRFAWRTLAIPLVGRSSEREPATPHRFAKLLGAVGTGGASALLLAGIAPAGFAVAAAVGLLAGIGATTGFCLGCRMYRQVSFLRERGVV